VKPKFFESRYWNSPPREPHGDVGAEQIYQAVGTALSQWEQIESILGEAFATFVESNSPAAQRAYGSIISAVGRCSALNSAASIFFDLHPEKEKQPYTEALKAVEFASARRNEIAHGVVKIFATPETIGGGYYLLPPDYNSRKTEPSISFPTDETLDPFAWTSFSYAYTSQQILDFTKRFQNLERIAFNMARGLSSKPPSYSTPPSGEAK
tara:strand:- start:300 stop:929 length:630 start_codon:yes stop_codon:yes gene_type:complete